jgi:hypothetical protein
MECNNMNPCRVSEGIEGSYLEGVAAVGFAINHVGDFVEDTFAGCVACCPVVSCSAAVFAQVDVFGIVELAIWSG